MTQETVPGLDDQVPARRHGVRKVRAALAALGLVAVALCAWLYVARRPVTYIGPPLDSTGARMRVRIPLGWAVRGFRSFRMPPGQAAGIAEMLIEDAGSDWRPVWLQRWFPRKRRHLPFMVVRVYRYSPAIPAGRLPGPGGDGSLGWREAFPIGPAEKEIDRTGAVITQIYWLGRDYYSPDGRYQIDIQYHDVQRNRLTPMMNDIGSTIRVTR